MIEWLDGLHDYATQTPPRDEAHEYKLFTDNLIRLLHIKEDAQLAIGEALKGVESIYSECTIQGIADDIGASASSLYSYRDLAECFTHRMRAAYRAKGLSFSHLRSAYTLETFEAIHDFLEACLLNAWTTRQAADEARMLRGNSPRAHKITGVVCFRREKGAWVMEGIESMGLEANVRYRVTFERAE